MVYRPATPPALPIPHLGVCVLTHLLLGVDGGHAETRGRGVTGVCDPAQLLDSMMVVVVLFSPRESAPPELTLAFFASARVDLGVVVVVFVCNHTT